MKRLLLVFTAGLALLVFAAAAGAFDAGDKVTVKTAGQVLGQLADGRYVVQTDGGTLVVPGSALDPVPTPTSTPTPTPTSSPEPTVTPTPTPTTVPDPPPTAEFAYSPASPVTGTAVRLDGGASTCPATPCTYVWEDDGNDGPGGTQWPLGTGEVVNFTFQVAATKHVRLTVTDAQNRAATVMHDIVVDTPTPSPSPTPTPTPTPTATPTPEPSGSCDRNATTSTFASQVSAATAGQVICLADGNYGNWAGTGGKTLTVRAAEGATASMSPDLYDGNVTIEGLTITGADIEPRAIKNVTFRNNKFTGRAWFRSTATDNNIVVDGGTFNNINVQANDVAGRLYWDGPSGCGYVVRNVSMTGGDADGVRVGCRGVQILNSRFVNFGEGANHTDPIQVYGGSDVLIKGNYFDESGGSEIAAFLQATGYPSGMWLEDNVFRAGNVADLANLGGVPNSRFIHNTVETGDCLYGKRCGTLIMDGAQLTTRDNVLAVGLGGDHNLVQEGSAGAGNMSGTPLFVGPLNEWAGWALEPLSPGVGQASDGLNVGINVGG